MLKVKEKIFYVSFIERILQKEVLIVKVLSHFVISIYCFWLWKTRTMYFETTTQLSDVKMIL